MKPWLKITISVVATLLIIFIIGGYVMYRMLNTSLPVYEGELKSTWIKGKC